MQVYFGMAYMEEQQKVIFYRGTSAFLFIAFPLS